MKVCLNKNLDYTYLKNANEIKFNWMDRKDIEKFVEMYPNADIILNHSILTDTDLNLKWIQNTNILIKKEIILSLDSFENAKIAKEEGIKFYLDRPINSYYDLNNICELLKPTYLVLGPPLFFDLENIKKRTDISIRSFPNIAFNDMPRKNGINGTWIRPEDIEMYEPYISTIEFKNCDKSREQALYRIYIERKEWPGELKEIITNFGSDGLNRILKPEIFSKRLICQQKCERDNSCKMCYTAINLANRDKIEQYLNELNLDKN